MLFELLISFLIFIPPLYVFFKIITKNTINYPVEIALFANRHRFLQWMTPILQAAPSGTIVLKRLNGAVQVITANPANVQHILKTQFHNYPKGIHFRTTLFDFLGHGIVNVDGDSWKLQRQVSKNEFNTNSLRRFMESSVETELSVRLIPILSAAAADKTVIDFQDIIQRFMFDTVCKFGFGYDPEYLLPSFPPKTDRFSRAFDDAVLISTERFLEPLRVLWRIKRFLNIGSEKRLRVAINRVHEYAHEIITLKKKKRLGKTPDDHEDLLSRFLSSGEYDDNFVRDFVISIILAGRDTTSAALTWFFWLLSQNPEIETQILKEINKSDTPPVFEDVKNNMPFTHASLSESMRLYPPIPVDGILAEDDDVWPDRTVLKKGTKVTYHVYAMGRMESIWGNDWSEYKPERWLKKLDDQKWVFEGKDPYSYPVFRAGPRICLGKELAFLQMKRFVAEVLRRFKVVPATTQKGFEPEFLLTAKMKGGFPVLIEERL